ncbi:hypothetical protein AB4068_15540 [Arthrobacter sp. 2RAF22]|uniref:hypothetical protein n=1 Tax=Arthrobacter sp. 2RAF22 TaxID=3232996 RepID=UPI003F8E2800
MKSLAPVEEAETRAVAGPAGLISFVLAENRNDVLSLGMFAYYVSRHPLCQGRPLRSTALRYLENALAAGLMTVGDVDGDRYRPWPVPYTEALERIRAAWPDNNGPAFDDLAFDEPAFNELRDVCWLANTARGDRAADLRAYGSARSSGLSPDEAGLP